MIYVNWKFFTLLVKFLAFTQIPVTLEHKTIILFICILVSLCITFYFRTEANGMKVIVPEPIAACSCGKFAFKTAGERVYSTPYID